MTKSFQKGGLNMIDTEKFIHALKSTWVKRIWNNDGAQWAQIIDSSVFPQDNLVLLGPSWHKMFTNKITNPFWKDILSSWSKINKNILLKNFSRFYYSLVLVQSQNCHRIFLPPELVQGWNFSAQQTSWIVKESFQ